ncbi:MAG TPA: FAD-dependent oxidoreductase [Conexibacter sp.]|jgi:glycine/D-amino acid oxidase-like deaminating enzyme/nitrite reductase/ring-hydroxylating ferredoxin subunit
MRATTSIWLSSAPPSLGRPLAEGLDVDVAVLGGGISGITTALLCARDGATVAVLERETVAGTGGATGFTTAKASALQQTKLAQIRNLHGDEKTAAYAAAQLDALDLIEGLVERHAIDCGWQRLPDVTFALDRTQVDAVHAAQEAARAGGLAVHTTTPSPLPFEPPAAVQLDRQAIFDPVRYVRRLASLLVEEGGHVFDHTAVAQVHDGDPCRVVTAGGETVRAGAVVVCTNYPLLDRGAFFARMSAERSYVVAARVLDDPPAAMAISAGEPTRSIRPLLTDDRQRWVLIGGEGHPTGSSKATPERYKALERFARERFDVEEIPFRWSTQDGMPVDKLPYAGRYLPRSSRLFVNAGHQKWGMTNATAGARVVADLIAGRDSRFASLLDPNRVTLGAVPDAAKAQASAAAHLVGDRLTPAEASSAAEVPTGEARVVRSGRFGKVGVHRDDLGAVHAVSLRCTHLGCILHWNDAERSWDCPCHGSRFGIDGQLLTGPASKPLETVEAPQ